MSDDNLDRIGTVVTDSLTRVRSVLLANGYATDVRDEIDIAAGLASFEVVAAGVVVYRISLDFSGELVSSVVGRFDLEGLRVLGLESVANKVQATAAMRAS